MGNHYHRFETPEGNLVEGMKWLQNTYTRKFNESLWHSRVTSCPKAATYYQHEIGRRDLEHVGPGNESDGPLHR